MEPSSPASHPLTPEDALVLEVANIRQALDAIASQQQKVEQLLRQQLLVLTETRKLIDGFTDSGGSYRAYQVDPMIMVYAALLGPVLSDRLDSQASKGDSYMADMTKGSAVLARQLLRTLDEYRGSREGMDYIESEMQGSTLFPGNPPSTNSSNEPPT